MTIKSSKYYKFNLLTLLGVNSYFDHMLVNSFIYTNLSLITKRYGELIKIFKSSELLMISLK